MRVKKGLMDPKKVKHLAELHFPLGGPRSRSSTNCRIKPMKRKGRSVLFSFNRERVVASEEKELILL